MKNTRDDFDTEDCEVGYQKPPKRSQFKKGVSGNPSGRPKKAQDLDSQVLREMNADLPINENGKRRVIKKREGVVKQLVNKALSGKLSATRLLIPFYERALEKEAELQRMFSGGLVLNTDLTNEQLKAMIARALLKEHPDVIKLDVP
ncbi:MAG: DUF5681 domain-containing protein [Acidobacteriaceae bacterium]